MLQSYQIPIKGTFYYAAEMAVDENLIDDKTILELRPEPENNYDGYALQIFLPTTQNPSNPGKSGLLLGYVPRQLSPIISRQLKSHCPYSLQVIHRAKLGKRIEIECLLNMQLPWFTALNLLLLTIWVQQLKQFKRLQRYLTHTNE